MILSIRCLCVKAKVRVSRCLPCRGWSGTRSKRLVAECRAATAVGIKAVALFPVTPVELKDERGTEALNPDCLVLRAVKAVKAAVPDLVVITDVALDPYTTTGHDGVLNAAGSGVDNDATVEILAKMAVVQADAGVDWVAPSDMMDGRVGAIRSALDAAGHTHVAILAYSAKYASAFYGPFRDAVGSQQAAGKSYLDKKTYQLNPANPRESMVEAALDIERGRCVDGQTGWGVSRYFYASCGS